MLYRLSYLGGRGNIVAGAHAVNIGFDDLCIRLESYGDPRVVQGLRTGAQGVWGVGLPHRQHNIGGSLLPVAVVLKRRATRWEVEHKKGVRTANAGFNRHAFFMP